MTRQGCARTPSVATPTPELRGLCMNASTSCTAKTSIPHVSEHCFCYHCMCCIHLAAPELCRSPFRKFSGGEAAIAALHVPFTTSPSAAEELRMQYGPVDVAAHVQVWQRIVPCLPALARGPRPQGGHAPRRDSREGTLRVRAPSAQASQRSSRPPLVMPSPCNCNHSSQMPCRLHQLISVFCSIETTIASFMCMHGWYMLPGALPIDRAHAWPRHEHIADSGPSKRLQIRSGRDDQRLYLFLQSTSETSETFPSMCHHAHHHTHDHVGHLHVCTPKTCACGFTLLLVFCVTCAEPVHGQHHHACSGGACRALRQEEAAAQTSFVTWLGTETPIDHILELYRASGSQEDLSAWLLQSR